MSILAGDRTANTSGQVINLNTNTAFKCVPHILGSLQVFGDSSKALCRCTLLFCSLFQFPLETQSFQYVSGETRTYPEPPGNDLDKQASTITQYLIWRTENRKYSKAWNLGVLNLPRGSYASECLARVNLGSSTAQSSLCLPKSG